ncbi:hypothetical protein MMC17_008103 [Xylographa soralifera]|nr:hypothetical protein [Xylographa soralifera]
MLGLPLNVGNIENLKAEITAARVTLEPLPDTTFASTQSLLSREEAKPSLDMMIYIYDSTYSIINNADPARTQLSSRREALLSLDRTSAASDDSVDQSFSSAEDPSEYLEASGLLDDGRAYFNNYDSTRPDLNDFVQEINNVTVEEMTELVTEDNATENTSDDEFEDGSEDEREDNPEDEVEDDHQEGIFIYHVHL